jgi:glucose-1-phosphate cytidylyltransferase
MKTPVILLAGGYGTRISEETETRPKPMVLIQGKPILWHVMNIYASQGFTCFRIASGYKHEVIDEWVYDNNLRRSWGFDCDVKAIFTGLGTQTAGRIRQVIESDPAERYMMTYGDGLANIDLKSLLEFHRSHRKTATVTSVRPPARFGHIDSADGVVTHFGEKLQANAGWINGGFFVLEDSISNYLQSDSIAFEQEPMMNLVKDQELMTSQHFGFWQPMDTLREKIILEDLSRLPKPPWQDLEFKS